MKYTLITIGIAIIILSGYYYWVNNDAIERYNNLNLQEENMENDTICVICNNDSCNYSDFFYAKESDLVNMIFPVNLTYSQVENLKCGYIKDNLNFNSGSTMFFEKINLQDSTTVIVRGKRWYGNIYGLYEKDRSIKILYLSKSEKFKLILVLNEKTEKEIDYRNIHLAVLLLSFVMILIVLLIELIIKIERGNRKHVEAIS